MRRLILLITMTILINIGFSGTCFASDVTEDAGIPQMYKAKVLEIKETIREEYQEGNIVLIRQIADVQILEKEHKNEIVEAVNNMSGNPAFDIDIKEGDMITVTIESGEYGEQSFVVTGYERTGYAVQIIGLFLILLIIIGRWKGFKSILSLGVTISLVFFVMIPLLLKGMNPILVSIGVCAIATIATMVIIAGWNKKSFSAMIGTVGGITIGGAIAYIYGIFAHLSGLGAQEAQMLNYIPQQIAFDYRGLLFAGILIGALGAAMDVSISIASALTELSHKDEKLSHRQMITHGMNIGKDIMGTMSNTLILAYTGGALSMILLFMAYNTPLRSIINLDIIMTEIVRSIAGSIGLLFAIPITAFSYAMLSKEKLAQ